GAHAAERQRVEDDHDVLDAAEAGQPHGRAVLVLQLEVGRLVAYFHGHAWSFHRIAERALPPQVCHLPGSTRATPFGPKTGRPTGQRRTYARRVQGLIDAPSGRRDACPTSRGPRSRSTSETGRP